MKLVKRDAFGWPASKAGKANPRAGLCIHYDGSDQGLAGKPHTACVTYWKNTRAFHMGPRRGWADVGYSWSACPHGVIFEGRGLGRVQAAQPGGNATWYSVSLMSGPSEDPTPAQIDAVRQLRAWLMAKGVKAGVKGHRDFFSTSCLPVDTTEVLTHRGWVGLADVTADDRVASWAIDSNTVTFDRPAAIVEPYEAETMVIDGFESTPDHNWVTFGSKPSAVGCSCGHTGSAASIRAHGREGRKRGEPHETLFEERWKLVRADEMKRVNRYLGAVDCGGGGLDLTDDQIRLLVWLQGDGHVMREPRGRNAEPYGVEWHLRKTRKVERLEALLRALDVPFRRNERRDGTVSLRVYGDVARDRIIALLPDKRFHWGLLNLSARQARVFLYELLEVDGCRAGSYYSSADPLNLDVVQAVSTLNGQIATRGKDPRKVLFRAGPVRDPKRREVHRIEAGRRTLVGCLTTLNGTLIVRQGGRTIIVGNCPGDRLYRLVKDGTFAREAQTSRKDDDMPSPTDLWQHELKVPFGTEKNPSWQAGNLLVNVAKWGLEQREMLAELTAKVETQGATIQALAELVERMQARLEAPDSQ